MHQNMHCFVITNYNEVHTFGGIPSTAMITSRRLNGTVDTYPVIEHPLWPCLTASSPEISAPFANAYVYCLTELIPSFMKFVRLRKTSPPNPKNALSPAPREISAPAREIPASSATTYR